MLKTVTPQVLLVCSQAEHCWARQRRQLPSWKESGQGLIKILDQVWFGGCWFRGGKASRGLQVRSQLVGILKNQIRLLKLLKNPKSLPYLSDGVAWVFEVMCVR